MDLDFLHLYIFSLWLFWEEAEDWFIPALLYVCLQGWAPCMFDINKFRLWFRLLSQAYSCWTTQASWWASPALSGCVLWPTFRWHPQFHSLIWVFSIRFSETVFIFLQKTDMTSIHLLGAGLTFGPGTLYILVQTGMSYRMQPRFHGRDILWARMTVGMWSLISIITRILFPNICAFVSVCNDSLYSL